MKDKGFTLELMIVVAIIGILSAIAIPNLMNFQCRRRFEEHKEYSQEEIGEICSEDFSITPEQVAATSSLQQTTVEKELVEVRCLEGVIEKTWHAQEAWIDGSKTWIRVDGQEIVTNHPCTIFKGTTE